MRKARLKNLRIRRVSLVDAPANKRAFIFFKSEEGGRISEYENFASFALTQIGEMLQSSGDFLSDLQRTKDVLFQLGDDKFTEIQNAIGEVTRQFTEITGLVTGVKKSRSGLQDELSEAKVEERVKEITDGIEIIRGELHKRKIIGGDEFRKLLDESLKPKMEALYG